MKTVLKKINNAKIIDHFLDWTGILFLGAFIMNTGLLWFFMRTSISCTFVDAAIVFVRCGSGWTGRFLDFFFFYFSPLIGPMLLRNWHALFNPPPFLTTQSFFQLLIFFIITLFVLLSSIWILRKSLRGVFKYRYDRQLGRKSALILLLIFLPALISFGVRVYLVPSPSSSRIMKVDIWNGTFAVPRNQLKEWSFITLDRPDKKPTEYFGKLTRWWKVVPHLTFYYDLRTGGDIAGRNLEISVNPHFRPYNEQTLSAEKTRWVDGRLALVSEINNQFVYPSTETQGEWEVHRSSSDPDFFQDLYIMRGTGGKPERMLQCTPDEACAVKTAFSWATYKCDGKNINCNACSKVCVDLSQGTLEYDIKYTFDKKYLDYYPEFDKQIRDYISSFYTSKFTKTLQR